MVREEGYLFDSVLVKGQDGLGEFIALEDIFYTNIENTEWLDNTRYAIRGHVNPSLGVHILINIEEKKITGKYYGIGFSWNKNKDRLYYIEASPYYGEQVLSKVMDNEGHIYFEAQQGESILEKLAVSADDQILAFFIDDSGRSRKLIVIKMDMNNKLQKKIAIDAQFGDIEIIDNKTIIITSPGGTNYYYYGILST